MQHELLISKELVDNVLNQFPVFQFTLPSVWLIFLFFRPAFLSESERLEWEQEQKQLDREWYENDGVYDDEYNPFAKVYCRKVFMPPLKVSFIP